MTKIDVSHVHHYFASVQRDTLDLKHRAKRATQVAAICDRLMTYSDETFLRAIHLLEAMDTTKKDATRDLERASTEKQLLTNSGQ